MSGGHMSNGTVQLAYLHSSRVSHSWHDSMRKLRDYDRARGARLREQELNIRAHPIKIAECRNLAAKAFLDHSDAEWLFWVDTDMGFEADALERLLEAADPDKAPVVGALCFANMESGWDGMGGYRFKIVPTMYRIGRTEDGSGSFCEYGAYPDDAACQVAATGSAFIVIHRTVLEKVRAEHGDHWYHQLADEKGEVVGEDLSFCLRAGAMGIPMFVHTGVKTTHHKEMWLSEDDFRLYLAGEAMTNPAPDLPIFVDLAATVAALAAGEHDHDGMLKFTQDLDRYAEIIEATKPEVVIETGTHHGQSAQWFAAHGVDVITVDVNAVTIPVAWRDRITQVVGDSTDLAVVEQVRQLVDGRRVMVSLDSSHTAEHVRREIYTYGPMVSPGCYLVVEDTIFGYDRHANFVHGMDPNDGSPLDAVLSHLVGRPEWSRDVAIEQTGQPISQNPAGWWVRVNG
jgi:cephalosporin hydroxylase